MTAWWSVRSLRPEEEFARLVEGGRAGSSAATPELAELAELALGLRPAGMAPAPEFRASLRAQLLAERPSPAPASLPPAPAGRGGVRRWAVGTAAAAGLVLTATGTAAASTAALPGEPLYGVKRGIESVQLALAPSQTGKGERQLTAANERLDEVRQLLLADPRLSPETIRQARETLLDLQASAQSGTDLLLTAANESRGSQEEGSALEELAGFLDEAHQQMAALNSQVPSGLSGQWKPSVALVGSLQQRTEVRIGNCSTCADGASRPGGPAMPASSSVATPLRTPPAATADPAPASKTASPSTGTVVPRPPSTSASPSPSGSPTPSPSASPSTTPSATASTTLTAGPSRAGGSSVATSSPPGSSTGSTGAALPPEPDTTTATSAESPGGRGGMRSRGRPTAPGNGAGESSASG